MLAGRYQILGLLGKGGMGEVYRANDLTLDQAVALKFLPDGMSGNPSMLARFHSEVRIARQVSHPNVCRVYDIGEVDGQLFLSMEYIDGEDLGSLLRRIGHLPGDKAVEFARKICAGLAAAHDKGVLHRDLKPANIMIDSHGQVMIMDFGLAAVAVEMQGLEARAGTPAYQAPEQLAGREVTVRSDIYALGLVLYEMFTGKRPFESETLAEMMRLQEMSTPPSLSTVIKDLDPAVEQVIMRCLAPDPRNRPGSALAVAAGLPGGDRLAAALAAGETPSPDLVAASADTAGIRPGLLFLCFAACVIGVIAIAYLAPMAEMLTMVPLELPPDAMTEKAREMIRAFGYTQKPSDSARGFGLDHDCIRYLQQTGKRWSGLASGAMPVMTFWYRQSPRYLEPTRFGGSRVNLGDPPANISNMVSLILDSKAHLIDFYAVPPQIDSSPGTTGPPNWPGLFAAAGLDISRFAPAEPIWTPLAVTDARAAWTGSRSETPDIKLRVEAAAWKGHPVFFKVIAPWTRASRMDAYRMSTGEKFVQFLIVSLALCVLTAASLLARYNLKRGRGDRKGATRLAAFAAVVFMTIWLLNGSHVPTKAEVDMLFMNLSLTVFVAGAFWVVYLALEPYLRRHWPHSIISWTRLIAGGVRDPIVGRDVLLGIAFGVFSVLMWAISSILDMRYGAPPFTSTDLTPLLGAPHALATVLNALPNSLIQLLVSMFLLFVLKVALRKDWLAGIAFILMFTLLNVAGSSTISVDAGFAAAVAIAIYFVLTKFGFVTFLTGMYVNVLFTLMPLTSDFSSWYAGQSLLALLVVIGLAAFGLHSALAGRSIIQDELL